MSTEDRRNVNFVQIAKTSMAAWRGLIRKKPLAAQLLMFFVEKMSKHQNTIVCSYATLQELTGYSRTSVAKAVKVLKDDNWIQAIKIGSSTAYVVNERVAWQAHANQRKYAIFSATVVASSSEQAEDFADAEKLKTVPFVEAGERALITDEDLPPPDQADLALS